jgi:hypothetical protein
VNVLQLSVPGIAAEAVNVKSIQTRGREAGVRVVRFTYRMAYRYAGDSNEYRCRITCSAQMAVFFIEQLAIAEVEAAHRGETTLATACARAVRETYTSLMGGRRSRSAGDRSDGRARKASRRHGKR